MNRIQYFEQRPDGRYVRRKVGLVKTLQTSDWLKPFLEYLSLTTISNGVDVSKWQDFMMWTITRDAGAGFSYIKMTQGNVIKDSDAVENFRNSKNIISRRGGYHFLNSSPSGETQANYMLNFMRDEIGEYGELPVCLDVEISCDASLIKGFCYKVLERLGYFPLIYTSVGAMGRVTGDKSFLKNCPLWVAHWYVESPSIPAPWTDWVVHQYTNKGIGKEWGAKSSFIDLDRGKDEWLNQYGAPFSPITPIKQVIISSTDSPIMSLPATPTAEKIGALTQGDTLPVVEIFGDWYRIEGWILSKDTS